MEYKFKFENFRPSNDLKLSSTQLLGEILECAPSDSAPVARIAKRHDGYEATIEIFSSAGYFVARSFETNPDHALQTVKNRIERKLSQWKSNRFLEEKESNNFFYEQPNNQQGENHGTHIH